MPRLRICVQACLSVLYDHVQADFVIAVKHRLTLGLLTSGAWFEGTVKSYPKVLVCSETPTLKVVNYLRKLGPQNLTTQMSNMQMYV